MPNIRRYGVPDFAPHIEELLKLAGITSTPDARDALDSHLQMAWGTNRLANLGRQSAPPELFKQLENSIKKTQQLLRRLGMFPPTEDIEFDMFCYLEEGTITVAAQKGLRHVAPRARGSDFDPKESTIATINRQRVLDRLMRDLNKLRPKRKPGGQCNTTFQAVVGFAGHFFRQYSRAKLTTYPGGKFVPFCKLFYEISTGASCLDNHMLDTQIRAEVKSPQLGAKWIKR